MLSESEMVIYPHNKHFDKLFELLRIRKSWKPKNTPCHGQINDIDETEELDQTMPYAFEVGWECCCICHMISLNVIFALDVWPDTCRNLHRDLWTF